MLPALDLDELFKQRLETDLGGHHVPGLSLQKKIYIDKPKKIG